MDAGDGSTDLQEVGGGINGKAPRVEYARRYPEREIEPERRAEATGPDRPKRKRVDGRACYANSGEGARSGAEAEVRCDGQTASIWTRGEMWLDCMPVTSLFASMIKIMTNTAPTHAS